MRGQRSNDLGKQQMNTPLHFEAARRHVETPSQQGASSRLFVRGVCGHIEFLFLFLTLT